MPIPSPTTDETEAEFISRCHSALADEYDDEAQRHAVCMSAWEKEPASAAHVLSVMRVQQGVEVRREALDGRDHLVLPLVALVDGVFQCANCTSPNHYPAREFGKHPGAWNGRPVTIGHPMREGQFVSAGSPDVWDVERIGTTFNARVDGDALKLEAWIDPKAIERAGDEAQAVMAAIEDGKPVEVSTAAWVDEMPRMGAVGGRKYEAVQVNFQPDHMAILPLGQVGACSWEDGCGVRANVRAAEEARQPMTVQTITTTDGTGVRVDDGTAWSPELVRPHGGTAVGPTILSPQPCDCADGDCQCAPAAQQTDEKVAKAAADHQPTEDGGMADDQKRAAAPPPEDADKGKSQPKAAMKDESLEVRLAKLEAENDHLRAQLKAPGPATLDEYVKQAPTELRPALMSLVRAQRTRELEQIEVIKNAVPDLYTDEELRGMGADQLDKLVKVAQARGGFDYSVVAGQHSRLAQAAEAEDENYASLPASPWDAPAGQA